MIMENADKKRRWRAAGTGVALSLLLVACGGGGSSGGGGSTETPYADIPADPDIEAPATIPKAKRNVGVTFSAGTEESVLGRAAVRADGDDRIVINLAALIDSETGKLIRDVEAADGEGGNLYVVEDGKVKGVKLQKLEDAGGSVAYDIAFVIDTTGSMGGAIDGVKSSVNAFANYMAKRGLDIRMGAIAYGDYSPLTSYPSVPAGTPEEGPGGAYQNLTADFGSAGAVFNQYIDGLGSCYLGDCGGDGPENGLDGVRYAYDNFNWRPGAQRVIIVITDITVHTKGDDSQAFTEESIASLTDRLAGTAVVHAVSPTLTYDPAPYEDICNLAKATGGTCVDFYTAAADDYNLTKLPITSTITEGWVLTFVTSDPKKAHTLRVVFSNGSKKGEATLTLTYE